MARTIPRLRQTNPIARTVYAECVPSGTARQRAGRHGQQFRDFLNLSTPHVRRPLYTIGYILRFYVIEPSNTS
jgi:hypothetical protein